MSRRRQSLITLVLIAVVGLISACGSSGGGGGGNDVASHLQKAVDFSSCMRENGVSGFPDPGASGQLTIDAVANRSSVDTSSPTFSRALGACKKLEPAGFTGGTRSAQQQSAALKFAQCIREHGVTDFPDPTNGQPLVDTNRIPSAATAAGMSALNAAMRDCPGAAAAAGVHR